MHTWWKISHDKSIVAVEIDLSIVQAPSSSDLHFWALQASFTSGGASLGAGHLGLQWIDSYPGNTAVNWGGYRDQSLGGGTLDGTDSPLPSAIGNPHTRNFSWAEGERYRLRIDRGRIGWRGSVRSPDGAVVAVRELLSEEEELAHIVMWSEVFAPCEGPSATASWSNAEIHTTDGVAESVTEFVTSYQGVSDGGCSNTSIEVHGAAVLHRTATRRSSSAGATVATR